MQHTEKYKLDLIEKDDTFSPDPLNENMKKVEGALKAEAAARTAADAALDRRVSVLELHRCVTGVHAGSGFVDLGFTPLAVFAISSHGNAFVVREQEMSGLKIVEGGFEHIGYFTDCRYVAFF